MQHDNGSSGQPSYKCSEINANGLGEIVDFMNMYRFHYGANPSSC